MSGHSAVLPSDRKFGSLFTLVFAAGAAYFVYKDNTNVAAALGAVAVIFLALTLIRPATLHGLNKLWFQFGLLLGRVVSPIVLGAIFFLIMTPVGIGMRLFGRDELRLKKPDVGSYWIDRNPVGPAPESFKNQF